jgi:hypothetical protein
MARQPNNRGDFDAEMELNRIEAEGIAQRHRIDIDRVLAIYKRSPDTDFFPVLAPFQTNLDRAIAIVGKDKALQFFETEDLGKLSERVFLVDRINHFYPPLYSLDELQQVTEDFISHLLKNRIHLLDTGQPLTKFDRSLWLDRQLGKLYHFDFPAGCSLPPKEDQTRLNGDREKLLDVKVGTLKILSRAIKHQTPANLWEDCLRVLTEAVSADEAEFYLNMDQFYIGYDFKDKADKGAPEEIPGLDRPGGLTDLLEVIGHYEKELTIGTLAKTRNALADLLTFGQWDRPKLFISNYFEAIGHPLRDTLDFALDSFSFLELKESDFWEDYRDRVNDALQNEFYGEFIYRDKVKRKFIRLFQPEAVNHLKLMKAFLEATGRLPSISIPPVGETTTREDFVFQRENDFWTVIYEGKKSPLLKHEVGLGYIAYLLNRPYEKVHVMEVYHAGKFNFDPATTHYSKMSKDQILREGLNISTLGHAGTTLDLKAIAQYKEDVRELRRERDDAERNNDLGRMEKLNIDIQTIEERLTACLARGGKLRTDANANEKARKNVTNSVKHSLSRISKTDPDLWRHLFDHIHTGTFCSYTPEKPTPWKL